MPFNQESQKKETLEAQEEKEQSEGEVNKAASSFPPVSPNALGLDSPKSFFHIVLCFIGLFAFQTISTIWVLGSADIDEFSGKSTDISNKETVRDLDGSEVENRLSEIRIMAREARAAERKDSMDGASASSSSAFSRDGGDNYTGKVATSRVSTDVRKEVDKRLLRLRKSLQQPNEKYAPHRTSNSDSREGNLGLKKMRESQIYSPKIQSPPKGFGASKRNKKHSSTSESGGNISLDQGEHQVEDSSALEHEDLQCPSDDILRQIVKKVQANRAAGRELVSDLTSSEEMRFFLALQRKLDKEGIDDTKQWIGRKLEAISDVGTSQRNDSDVIKKFMETLRNGDRTFVEDGNSFEEGFQDGPSRDGMSGDRNCVSKCSEGTSHQHKEPPNENISKEWKTKTAQPVKIIKEDTLYGKKIPTSNNGTPDSQLQSKCMNNSVSSKDSARDIGNNPWWYDLPYVLAILLRRGAETDHESPNGLYSMKINSNSGKGSETSYVVAFEAQSEAANLCYLLESFFEDLGDFSADIVPLTVKELKEDMKSRGMKVIVVRKGQLRLHADQSLEEVEISLLSILEQSFGVGRREVKDYNN